MRKIASSHPTLESEFDRAFADHLCMFNPLQFIEQNGHIGLAHKVAALRSCLKATSAYSIQHHSRLPTDHGEREKWLHLYSTFWNEFVEQTLDELEQQISGKFDMSSVVKALPTVPAANIPQPERSHHSSMDRRSSPRKSRGADIKHQLERVRGCLPLYRGAKACTKRDCDPCLQMFDNLPLTRCAAVHGSTDPCVETGWFPHLNSSQWNGIKRAHDTNPKFDFKPKVPVHGQRENPLRSKPYSEESGSRGRPRNTTLGDHLPEPRPASPIVSDTEQVETTPVEEAGWVDWNTVDDQPTTPKRKRDSQDDFVPRRRPVQF